MRFYGIESKGRLILQKVDGLPTFDSARDEGRIVYNTQDGKIYHGTDSEGVEEVISSTLGSASERDYTISTDDPSGGSDGDVGYQVE